MMSEQAMMLPKARLSESSAEKPWSEHLVHSAESELVSTPSLVSGRPSLASEAVPSTISKEIHYEPAVMTPAPSNVESSADLDLTRFRVSADSAGTHHLGAEIGSDSPIFTLSHSSSNFDQELRPPNARDGDFDNIMQVCNGSDNPVPAHINPIGQLVQPGFMRILVHNGRVFLVKPGRWVLKQRAKLAGRCQWANEQPVNIANTNRFEWKTLTICRVGPGQIGLAFEHGTRAVLLAPGLHVYNDPMFKFQGTTDVQTSYFQHGSFHVVRVRRGDYALVWESPTQPRILREGNYAINSPNFRFEKFVNMSETYIKHGTIHIIQVPKGHIAKVFENVTPRLLADGVHMVDEPNFRFDGLEPLTAALIKHGTITRFRVNMGEIGMATWHNEAIFVDIPGTYEVDSPDFIYHKAEPVSAKLLINQNKKVVTVFSGEVGVSYRGGQLDILGPGRHVISSADHFFDCFMSTQQVTLRLSDSSASKVKDAERDLIIAETRDFVKVGLRADVFYSIADAFKTIIRVGKAGVQELVMETAIGTLTNIIRSTNLNEIAQSEITSAQSVDQAKLMSDQAMGQASAPLFFDKAHDEFLARLHDDFMNRYGIEISNIRVESFKIMDAELASFISRQAITTAQTENQLSNLKGQTEIATAEQERQARVAQIAAEQEARTLKLTTDSQNKAQLEKAESAAKSAAFTANQKADAMIAEARAEAEGIRLRAEAEAEAIRIKAKAEAERAEMLSRTPLGSQLALLSVWAETVQKSNEGIEKVVYCDPSIQNAAGGANPLGLLGLAGLGGLQSELERMSSPNASSFGSASRK